MRYEVNSLNTKRALALSLKEMTNKNIPIGKITVKMLTETSGVSRNTFYYHFDSINSLVLWTIHDEIYSTMQTFDDGDSEAFRNFIISYLSENQKFMLEAYQYLGYEDFQKNYIQELYPFIQKHIRREAQLQSVTLSDDYIDFLTIFFANQVGSLYIMFIHRSANYPEVLASRSLQMIFDISIPYMVREQNQIRDNL